MGDAHSTGDAHSRRSGSGSTAETKLKQSSSSRSPSNEDSETEEHARGGGGGEGGEEHGGYAEVQGELQSLSASLEANRIALKEHGNVMFGQLEAIIRILQQHNQPQPA